MPGRAFAREGAEDYREGVGRGQGQAGGSPGKGCGCEGGPSWMKPVGLGRVGWRLPIATVSTS